MKYKNKGFTLVETLLVIAVVSIASIKIYSNYKQQIIDDTANRQALYIKKLISDVSSIAIDVSTGLPTVIGPTFNLTNSVSAITNATSSSKLISAGIVPSEMIEGTSITNLWGGTISVSGVNLGGSPGIQFFLNNLPIEGCARIITNDDIVANTQSITVNGTTVKNIGDSAINGTSATACNANNNTIVLTADLLHTKMKFPGLNYGTPPPSGPNYFRSKETQYNIAPNGQFTASSSTSCPTGSTWNSTTKVCSCPTGKQWVGDGSGGDACRTENSSTNGQAGLCDLGFGWDVMTNTCVALPTRAAVTITNPWVGSITSNVTPSSSINYGNRKIPGHIGTSPSSSSHEFECLAIPNGYWDGVYCQVCVNGSWQNDRCVLSNNSYVVSLANTDQTTCNTTPRAQWSGTECQVCLNGTWKGSTCSQ